MSWPVRLEPSNLRLALTDAQTRAVALAEERDALRRALADAQTQVAALAQEREAAWAIVAKSEARTAEARRQRDRLWTNAKLRAEELGQDREFLARRLVRTYQHPWRPIKHRLNSLLLRALARIVRPIDKRSSSRLRNSAEKRTGNLFRNFLARPALSSAAVTRRKSGNFNILFFTPFPSHPMNRGNQARIHHMARRLQLFGHKVHFVLLQTGRFDTAAERAMRETWDTFDISPNSKKLMANGSDIPFDGWYEPGLGEDIRVLCDAYDIDVIFCSYVFQSKLLEYVPPHILKIIDTHDKMGDRYDMLRRNGQPFEFFSCTPEEEGSYLRRADVVIAVREQEARYFDDVTGQHSSVVVAHVETPCYTTKIFDKLRNVGIVASASHLNLTMTLDFIEAVTRFFGPRPPFIVHVAGQVKDIIGKLPGEQSALFEASWVRMHGFVPDIGNFYEIIDLIVSPVTLGTGINIKTVEAMAHGMPVVATQWGSKGIETDEPMHNYRDVQSLAGGLMNLAGHPDELKRLAAVSRARYDELLRQATGQLKSVFNHQKLSA
jgi:glycosyltransferase involved in cell wall biosynthesis